MLIIIIIIMSPQYFFYYLQSALNFFDFEVFLKKSVKSFDVSQIYVSTLMFD